MLDDTTHEYVQEVHRAFARKAAEIDALRQRLEPPHPRTHTGIAKARGAAGARAEVTERTRVHVDHRYDVGLAHMRGYPYNPRRAYFQRDSQGRGQLLFEPGISLLLVSRHYPGQGQLWEMPDPSGARLDDPALGDDRWWVEWRRRRGLPLRLPPPPEGEDDAALRGSDSRMARVDAFLAMFEQRQALTQFVGMAPVCAFVGERFEDLGAHRARYPDWPRPAPRPDDLRLVQHRYLRFCVAMSLSTPLRGPLACVVLAERRAVGEPFRLHALVSEWPGDAAPPGDGGAARDEEILERVEPEIMRQWNRLALHEAPEYREYPVFDERLYPLAQNSHTAGLTVTECPNGDGELLFRVGLLLESPSLEYAPWDTAHPLRSLGALLGAAPVALPEFREALATGADDGGTGADAERRVAWLWMRYVLMLRCYPYSLLAHHDMRARLGYEAYRGDTPLRPGEVERFRAAIEAGHDTMWIDVKKSVRARARHQKRARLAKDAPPAGDALPSRAKEEEEEEAEGGAAEPARLKLVGALSAGSRRTRRQARPGGGDVVPRVGDVRRCRVAAATWSGANLAEARFMAVRCVEDALEYRDPLYVAQEFDAERVADAEARRWRRAIFRHVRPYDAPAFAAKGGRDAPDVLWMLGAQALDWLYGDGGGAAWEAAAGASSALLPRLGWHTHLLHTVDPRLEVNRRPLTLREYRAMKQGSPDALPLGQPDKRYLLRAIAAGLAPIEHRAGAVRHHITYETRGDFRVMMAAVVLSLLKEGLLFIAPSPEHYRAMDRGRLFDPAYAPTNLRGRVRAWLRDHRATLMESLAAFPRAAHARALNPLGSLAVLAWEWGLWEGLRRYLHWVDALWAEETGRDYASDRYRVSNRLVRSYPVIAELVYRHTGRTEMPETPAAAEPPAAAVAPLPLGDEPGEVETESPKSARSAEPERLVERREEPEERVEVDYDVLEDLPPGEERDEEEAEAREQRAFEEEWMGMGMGRIEIEKSEGEGAADGVEEEEEEKEEEEEERGEEWKEEEEEEPPRSAFAIEVGEITPEERAEAEGARESALGAQRRRVRELEALLRFVEGVHGYAEGELEGEFMEFTRQGVSVEALLASHRLAQTVEGLGGDHESPLVYVARDSASRPMPVPKAAVSVTYQRALAPASPAGARAGGAPRRARRKRWSVDAVDSAVARLRALRGHRTARRSGGGAWDI